MSLVVVFQTTCEKYCSIREGWENIGCKYELKLASDCILEMSSITHPILFLARKHKAYSLVCPPPSQLAMKLI